MRLQFKFITAKCDRDKITIIQDGDFVQNGFPCFDFATHFVIRSMQENGLYLYIHVFQIDYRLGINVRTYLFAERRHSYCFSYLLNQINDIFNSFIHSFIQYKKANYRYYLQTIYSVLIMIGKLCSSHFVGVNIKQFCSN